MRHGWLICGLIVLAGCGWAEQAAQAQPEEGQAAKRPPANRLAKETSPYLLLHAHNPVDWYPWGPEAFEKARKENKLIFLSIGYSSCYWCHVMERKVFSHPEIARYMNEHFVNIKVDREERPDVDDVYMTALQVYMQLTGAGGSGGWPLSMFLTPDLKPLGGGTYFPPEDTADRDGFQTILTRINEAWSDRPEALERTGEALTKAVQNVNRQRLSLTPVELKIELAQGVADVLLANADLEYGGLDFNANQPRRPKFPVPVKLAFLQAWSAQHPQPAIDEVLTLTLDRLAAGGIYDHLGGGFHRYSTDRYWRVPHFEKMLYDNAQLLDVYVTAYAATGNFRYRAVAEEIVAFVLRDLTDADGGFYSALDAETDGVEGKLYVWTREEIQQSLTPDEARLCALHYGLDGDPNFEQHYVLEVVRPVEQLAADLQRPEQEVRQRLQEIRTKLLAVRQQRQPVLRDDKILTSWNGLMIGALARAARVLQREDYLQAAERAAMYVITQVRDREGQLLHSACKGQAHLPAFLDDYALFVDGLLALREATDDKKWLNAAVKLNEQQTARFWDNDQGGYYYTAAEHEQPLLRTRQIVDSVLPSGNSVAARNLLQLSRLTSEPALLQQAEETLQACAPAMSDTPRGASHLARALTEFLALAPAAEPAAEPGENEGAQQSPNAEEEIVLIGGDEEQVAPPKKEEKKPKHVDGMVYLSVDRLPAGKECEILVRLEIEEGWHINPNPAADEFSIPTVLTLKSGQEVELLDEVYPKPVIKETPGLKKKLEYYEGRTLIWGKLKVPEAAAGKMDELEFRVKFQACNKDVCLAPTTLSLKVPVKVARAGEPVKPINEKLFAKPAKKP